MLLLLEKRAWDGGYDDSREDYDSVAVVVVSALG
jgi:hypothetical protein